MTPTVPPISLSDVLTELKVANPSRTAPISLGDSDVLALAGKSAPPISLSDLYGKSSYVPMVITATNGSKSAYSGASSGTVTCNPSVSVANGKGVKRYLWSFTSNPDGCNLANATSATCAVSYNYLMGEVGETHPTLQCVVTDDVTSVTKTGIIGNLFWSP